MKELGDVGQTPSAGAIQLFQSDVSSNSFTTTIINAYVYFNTRPMMYVSGVTVSFINFLHIRSYNINI